MPLRSAGGVRTCLLRRGARRACRTSRDRSAWMRIPGPNSLLEDANVNDSSTRAWPALRIWHDRCRGQCSGDRLARPIRMAHESPRFLQCSMSPPARSRLPSRSSRLFLPSPQANDSQLRPRSGWRGWLASFPANCLQFREDAHIAPPTKRGAMSGLRASNRFKAESTQPRAKIAIDHAIPTVLQPRSERGARVPSTADGPPRSAMRRPPPSASAPWPKDPDGGSNDIGTPPSSAVGISAPSSAANCS